MQTHDSSNKDAARQHNRQNNPQQNQVLQHKVQPIANAENQFESMAAMDEVKAESPLGVAQMQLMVGYQNSSLQSAQTQLKSYSQNNTIQPIQTQLKSYSQNSSMQSIQTQLKSYSSNSSTAAIQRQLMGGWGNSPIQKKEVSSGAAPNTTGLPDNLKSGMENMTGVDLSDTKVHYNSSKPAQLKAHAYAQGTDIHIASGQEKHLGHELAHVVQQKQGRVQPTTQMKGIGVNDDSGLEKEADDWGAKAWSYSSSSATNTTQLKAVGGAIQLASRWIHQDVPRCLPPGSKKEVLITKPVHLYKRNTGTFGFLSKIDNSSIDKNSRLMVSETMVLSDNEKYKLHPAYMVKYPNIIGYIEAHEFSFDSLDKVDSTGVPSSGSIFGAELYDQKLIKPAAKLVAKKFGHNMGFSLFNTNKKKFHDKLKNAGKAQLAEDTEKILNDKKGSDSRKDNIRNNAAKNFEEEANTSADNAVLQKSTEMVEEFAEQFRAQFITLANANYNLAAKNSKDPQKEEIKIRKATLSGMSDHIKDRIETINTWVGDKAEEEVNKFGNGQKESEKNAPKGNYKGTALSQELEGATQADITKRGAAQKLVTQAESFGAGINKIRAFIDTIVPEPGMMAEMAIDLKIPVGAGFYVNIHFGGTAEKDENADGKKTLAIESELMLGMGVDLLGFLGLEATFGLYAKAEAQDSTKALALISYAAHSKINRKSTYLANKLWGHGGKDDAKEWASEMEDAHLKGKENEGNFAELGFRGRAKANVGIGKVAKGELSVTHDRGEQFNADTIGKKKGIDTQNTTIEAIAELSVADWAGIGIKGVYSNENGEKSYSINVNGNLIAGSSGIVDKIMSGIPTLVEKSATWIDKFTSDVFEKKEAKEKTKPTSIKGLVSANLDKQIIGAGLGQIPDESKKLGLSVTFVHKDGSWNFKIKLHKIETKKLEAGILEAEYKKFTRVAEFGGKLGGGKEDMYYKGKGINKKLGGGIKKSKLKQAANAQPVAPVDYDYDDDEF